MRRFAWVLLAVGCTTDESEVVPEGVPPPGLQPRCVTPTRWTPGTVAFREATAEWALTGVEGVRLAAVDFDGDGWADLAVRRGPESADDLAGTRNTWLLRNTGEKAFEDVTVASGILARRDGNTAIGRPGSVFAFGDVDNDADLDLFVGLTSKAENMGETSELLLNQGDGTFALGPVEHALRLGLGHAPAGASFTDYDRNGALDLWVTENSLNNQPLQDHLFWGDGAGAFFDATFDMGLTTLPWNDIQVLNEARAHSNAWSSAACDLNGDGGPELLASSYGRAPNHLWQHVAGMPFVNRSLAAGYAFDHRVDWSDNESARCWCTLHPTDEDCAGVPPPAVIPCDSDDDAFRWNHATDREPFRLGGNSGTTVCGDADADGDLDLLTTEIVHWDVGSSSDPAELLFNDGAADVAFARPGNDVTGLVRDHIAGWNDGDMTGAIFDFDSDGLADVYIGSSDYPGAIGLLFHQVSPGQFEPVPVSDGIDHHRSHGIAVADFDRDGDLDVVVGHSRARCETGGDCYPTMQIRFFENQMTGNFVALELVGGAGSNRAAIGARIALTLPDGTKQVREIGGGHGHYGIQHDLVQHLGLGEACEVDAEIRWPDAALTTQAVHLVAGYRFRLEQGGELEVVEP
jgi:hypothetical protein